jgi:hypothetical protein
MRTLDSNSDPRPLLFRSPECRPNFVRASQKAPCKAVYQASSRLPVASAPAFPHFGKFEIPNAERPKPINPRNIRSGYVH